MSAPRQQRLIQRLPRDPRRIRRLPFDEPCSWLKVNEDKAFKRFLRESSHHAVAIVDEAYLEYTDDFTGRSAVSLVREGANVIVFRTFDKIHGLAGLPIGYTLTPAPIAAALRKQGAGDAEGLGRLNIAAAAAALADTAQVANTRQAIARERSIWLSVLRDLKLPHTDTRTNFIFFDAGQPQPRLAAALRARGVDIGRAHPPYTNWARITIGLPEENRRAQTELREHTASPQTRCSAPTHRYSIRRSSLT